MQRFRLNAILGELGGGGAVGVQDLCERGRGWALRLVISAV